MNSEDWLGNEAIDPEVFRRIDGQIMHNDDGTIDVESVVDFSGMKLSHFL